MEINPESKVGELYAMDKESGEDSFQRVDLKGEKGWKTLCDSLERLGGEKHEPNHKASSPNPPPPSSRMDVSPLPHFAPRQKTFSDCPYTMEIKSKSRRHINILPVPCDALPTEFSSSRQRNSLGVLEDDETFPAHALVDFLREKGMERQGEYQND